jgi:periplasmic protein TonB
VALATLLHLGLAAALLGEHATLSIPADKAPVMSLALAAPPVPPAPPAPPPPSPRLDGGGARPAAPTPAIHRLRLAPPSPLVTPPAIDLQRAPTLAALAVNTTLPTLVASGAPAGGGGSGAGSGVGAGDGSGSGSGGQAVERIRVVDWSAWVRRPSASEIADYYPLDARRQHVRGVALLACGVAADTKVRACQVLAEAPRGEGFGAAALEMSQLFRIRPTRVDGKVYDRARVAIPVYFGMTAPGD